MKDYLQINKAVWNERTRHHVNSEFYEIDDFMKGKSSLVGPEVEWLPDLKGKTLLHLQCHFGMDTLSLARRGADVTGLDLSDAAINHARSIAKSLNINANFVCTDVYSAPEILEGKYDLIYTSYGTIGWLPDMDRWAKVIADLLNPDGQLIFAEFHPMLWMYDSKFEFIEYPYFNKASIETVEQGSYAATDAKIELPEISWNHDLGEVLSALLDQGLKIEKFKEYDYSPYNCFSRTIQKDQYKYQIEGLQGKLPMLYALSAKKGA